jgi:hypothetical protein
MKFLHGNGVALIAIALLVKRELDISVVRYLREMLDLVQVDWV